MQKGMNYDLQRDLHYLRAVVRDDVDNTGMRPSKALPGVGYSASVMPVREVRRQTITLPNVAIGSARDDLGALGTLPVELKVKTNAYIAMAMPAFVSS
jgi:hypothetical protein